MKLKIIALAMLAGLPATHAAAQSVGAQSIPPNLSGLYRCVRSCAGPQVGRIVALGRQLVLTGPNGESIRAWIDWPGHIWVPALNEGPYTLRTASPYNLSAAASGYLWTPSQSRDPRAISLVAPKNL
jgi:hypothetical protein